MYVHSQSKTETPWTADIVMGKEYRRSNNSSPHLEMLCTLSFQFIFHKNDWSRDSVF